MIRTWFVRKIVYCDFFFFVLTCSRCSDAPRVCQIFLLIRQSIFLGFCSVTIVIIHSMFRDNEISDKLARVSTEEVVILWLDQNRCQIWGAIHSSITTLPNSSIIISSYTVMVFSNFINAPSGLIINFLAVTIVANKPVICIPKPHILVFAFRNWNLFRVLADFYSPADDEAEIETFICCISSFGNGEIRDHFFWRNDEDWRPWNKFSTNNMAWERIIIGRNYFTQVWHICHYNLVKIASTSHDTIASPG